MHRIVSGRSTRTLATLACLLAVTAIPARAEFTETRTLEADHVVVHNLIGEILIEGHRGSATEIEIHVQGSDASRDLIDIVTKGRGNELTIEFPVKESRRYVYPKMGSGTTRISDDEHGGWLTQLLGALTGGIKVSGRGSGLEVWADVTVRVPEGKSLEIDHGVGEIVAGGVDGDLILAIRSGDISVADVMGAVTVDTGSGGITVEDIRGDVLADTGSGSIVVEGVQGKLEADTGSGGVTVRHHEGDKLAVDTGSGSVVLDAIDTKLLHVDTGSGGVKARSVATDGAIIDTGSGSIVLELVRMGSNRFDVDTGSGSIRLSLPPDASAEISADTGSGGIDIDLAGDYTVHQEDRDEAEIRIGGGAARVVLDTGSGSISISQ